MSGAHADEQDWREVLAAKLQAMTQEEFRAELQAARERLGRREERRQRAERAAARLRSEEP